MMKTCVKYYTKDGMEFLPGTEYKVEFNPIDKRLYIYTVWGYTTISPLIINSNFI